MAIKFKQIQSKIEELYVPRAADEKKFADKHVVAITKDVAGNDSDYPNKGVKGKAKRLADQTDDEQKKVYENYPYVPNQIAYEDDEEPQDAEPAEVDYEGEMAKAELRAIATKAGALAQMMDDEMDLEAWLQSKISVAKKDIDSVYDYVVFSMMPRMNSEEFETALEMISEEALEEVLRKSDTAGKWISDFVHSDNPKFKGKSKKQRMKQALAAYYAKQRNEEVEHFDEAKARSNLYIGTVHKNDPDYDKKLKDLKSKAVGGSRTRGRAPTPEHKHLYKRGGALHRSSSQDVKPEHSSRVDVYGRKGVKEEVEHLDELSKKTLGNYVKKATNSVHVSSYRIGTDKPENAAKHGMKSFKRSEGINKAVDRLTKEEVELDEAKRGRPRKDGSTKPGEDEGGREHIVMQLRKAINLRGQKDVEFNSGEKHQVSVDHAKKALQMHDSMKKAEDKQEFAARLAKSHGSFKDAVAGKPAEPKKPKITLAKFAGKK